MKDVSKMDITERLREWSTYDDPPGVTLDDLLNEAADEIDRLSKAVRDAQGCILRETARCIQLEQENASLRCDHDWKVWPETDGKSQRCMKCGEYRDTPSRASSTLSAGSEGEPFMMLSCREAKQCLHNIPGCICDGDHTNG